MEIKVIVFEILRLFSQPDSITVLLLFFAAPNIKRQHFFTCAKLQFYFALARLVAFPIRTKQSVRFGGTAWRKTCKQNPKKGTLRWCGYGRRMPGSHKRIESIRYRMKSKLASFGQLKLRLNSLYMWHHSIMRSRIQIKLNKNREFSYTSNL